MTSLILGEDSDDVTFDRWRAGTYFNSAIQRIVWAAERLALTFAAVACPECQRTVLLGKRPDYPAVCVGASDQRAHIATHGRAVPTLGALLDNTTAYKRGDAFDAKNPLRMLRFDVNQRKHSTHIPGQNQDRQSAGSGDCSTWSKSGTDVQMKVAIEVFATVCRA